MMVRVSKCLLMLAVTFFYVLVVFNNVTDYDSNFQFVRHVLMMDTTFPGNHGMWRGTGRFWVETVFYLSIIACETVTAVLCGWGSVRLVRALRGTVDEFGRAKTVAVAGLTLGSLMWFVAFLSVGGEWFLMWQSKVWNGQDAAFRMFTVVMLVLLYVSRGEEGPIAG